LQKQHSDFIRSGPAVAMVWGGAGVVEEGRKMLGALRPSEAAMGTIRGDLCLDIGRNVCQEGSLAEIGFLFPQVTLMSVVFIL
jgi:nucleoside-diphosphate kinase